MHRGGGHGPLVYQSVDLRPVGPQALDAGADVDGEQLLHHLDGRTAKDHAGEGEGERSARTQPEWDRRCRCCSHSQMDWTETSVNSTALFVHCDAIRAVLRLSMKTRRLPCLAGGGATARISRRCSSSSSAGSQSVTSVTSAVGDRSSILCIFSFVSLSFLFFFHVLVLVLRAPFPRLCRFI